MNNKLMITVALLVAAMGVSEVKAMEDGNGSRHAQQFGEGALGGGGIWNL
ncbi:MAG: hypothetical protein LBJ69_03525 [Holosporales bacterium]|jgi:hypothetical protein|nr:hypothetical protein [Holosporales bacterium]